MQELDTFMQTDPGDREMIFRIILLGAATAGALLASIFSLSHGISDVFSFLYILPIILCVYFFPRRAVAFTLGISLLYIGQIYFFDVANPGFVAVATAWFAIFMTIGVVAASYANRMLDEQIRIKKILENAQDGILCFDKKNGHIIEINPKCAHWLRYDTAELVGSDLSLIWTDPAERERFLSQIAAGGHERRETEGLFRAKDGTILRFVISVLMVSRDRVFCSAIDITGSKIVDEEIRRTLEDLEEQVKARTAHLQRINEDLRAEILERRRFEETLLAAQAGDHEHPREGHS